MATRTNRTLTAQARLPRRGPLRSAGAHAALLMSLGALLAGCARPAAEVVSFSTQVQPIFTDSCATCHLEGAAPTGLVLSAGTAYENMVGVPSVQSELMRVKPGDVQGSYLIHKLEGTQVEVGGSGMQMPVGAPLSAEVIDLIRDWVAQGAKDN